jgi:hypothetical protein
MVRDQLLAATSYWHFAPFQLLLDSFLGKSDFFVLALLLQYGRQLLRVKSTIQSELL